MKALAGTAHGFVLACLGALAPAQTLVRDINQTAPPPPSDTGSLRLLRVVGNDVFFSRSTRNEAFELWRSDGTAGGTRLVADVCPGECSGMVDAEAMGARLFFVGFDAAIAGTRGLYVSDGTVGGTVRLVPAVGSFVDPTHLRALNGVVLFVADTPGAGRELWRTDGTDAGTMLLADIYPGPVGSDLRPMLVSGGVLYCTALHPLYGTEVWRSDGTVAGTRLLGETVIGGGSASEYDQMLEVGGVVYFGADVPPAGYELWRSDGSQAGTSLLADVNPGGGASYPSHFRAFQGNLVFTAYEPGVGRELWISDGTTAGTRLWVDVQPGSGSGNPSDLALLGNEIVFAATTPTTGTEPWATDGTVAGTRLLADLAPGAASSFPGDFVRSMVGANGLVFHADDGVRGREPWFTNGTAAGTRMLADAAPGAASSNPSKAVVTSTAAFFSAFDPALGRELWRTDGVTAAMVGSFDPGDHGSSPRVVLALGDETFYAARTTGRDDELWRTDGTTAGTFRVPDPVGGSVGRLASATLAWFFATSHAGSIYFVARGSFGAATYERALWRFDGRANTTTLVFGQVNAAGLTPGVGSVASVAAGVLFALLDGRDGRRKLMLHDPSANATSVLFDFGVGSEFDRPAGDAAFTRVGDVMFFHGHTDAAGGELWRTDGTASGTRLVRELALGRASAQPQFLTALDGALLFACRGLTGLYRSDGTAAGTSQVASLAVASPLTSGGGVAVFFADDGVAGIEPWVSDGTAANTRLLADLAPGAASSGVACAPVFARDTFFWLARDPALGFELWRSDGTPASTALVRDVNPGARPGVVWTANQILFPPVAAGSGRLVVFGGADPSGGVELWRSDGTSNGTVRFSDLRAGAASSTPRAFARTGRRMTLSIDDGGGQELFAIDLAALGGVLAAPYGVGCAGTGGQTPQAGAQGLPVVASGSFAAVLTRARAQSPWAMLLSATSSAVSLGGGCTLLPQSPLIPLTGSTDSVGTARAPLPIPNVPQLAGVELFVQFAVVDPAGAFRGVGAFSNGLHLVVGR